jgi:hypothetical protein
MRLVQIQHPSQRRVALVDEPKLRLIGQFDFVHQLAMEAINKRSKLTWLIENNVTDETLDYDAVYNGASKWQLMVPLDHPGRPASTLVSGTGLTHLGSARDRQAMHKTAEADAEKNLTDSMKMFRWGVEGGRPEAGKIGIAPEWFYKGNGSILRPPGRALDVPFFAEDGGEEGEIAGLYVIGDNGTPHRVGMAIGNEFSDHKFEKRNYLNLAGSKLRTCSIGPEIVIDGAFDSVEGEVKIERGEAVIWSKPIRTGESEMCHSLQNIEHHHFKFDGHRNPGDVHVHYFGAHSLSFGDGVQLADGDVMVVQFNGYGRPLRNPLRVAGKESGRLLRAFPME